MPVSSGDKLGQYRRLALGLYFYVIQRVEEKNQRRRSDYNIVDIREEPPLAT